MMTIESAMAVRLPAGANFCSSVALPYFRSFWSSDEASAGVRVTSRRFSSSGVCNVLSQRCRRLSNSSSSSSSSVTRRKILVKSTARASVEPLGSASDPKKQKGRSRYHPSEDIVKSTSENCEDARLTAPEISRTIIELNSKATLLVSDMSAKEESILWPELPYVTDEHGNVYFQVNNDKDFLQNFTSETNMMQIVIGLNTMEMLSKLELLGPSDIDFGINEIEAEDSDFEDEDENDDEDDDDDDDDDEDDEDEDEDEDEDDDDDDDEEGWVSVIDGEDYHDDSDETGDWAKLETMRFSHPLFFARALTEAASDDPINMMEQPPAGLAIQGLLRPAFTEEHSVIKRHIASRQSSKADINKIEKVVEEKLEDSGMINGHGDESVSSKDGSIWAEDPKNHETPANGTSFYKLEMIKIVLLSANGHPAVVEVEDYAKAKPDDIAHSAAKIISRLNAGGEKMAQALKSLCWRCKGIQVEEATLAGIDTLGFDVRVCSETQIQTLRFSFGKRATSEYSAERQLNNILFPRIQLKTQKKKETHQNEC